MFRGCLDEVTGGLMPITDSSSRAGHSRVSFCTSFRIFTIHVSPCPGPASPNPRCLTGYYHRISDCQCSTSSPQVVVPREASHAGWTRGSVTVSGRESPRDSVPWYSRFVEREGFPDARGRGEPRGVPAQGSNPAFGEITSRAVLRGGGERWEGGTLPALSTSRGILVVGLAADGIRRIPPRQRCPVLAGTAH